MSSLSESFSIFTIVSVSLFFIHSSKTLHSAIGLSNS